jgi:hypothetical protein
MTHRLSLVLAAAALLGAGAPPPLTLFDFKAGFDRRLLSTSDAEASFTPAGGLSVRTGHRADWPGATLKAPRGRWDLSRYAFVECDALNRGAALVEIHCRVDNPGADGSRHCLTGKISLAPGSRGKLRVPLSPTPWRLTKPLELIGMRAAPAAAEVLDPRNVTRLLFFVSKPTTDHFFEIGAVRAAGRLQELDAGSFLPFIDELGQFIHADWPGKTHSIEELGRNRKAEEEDLAARPGPPGRDRYGGFAGGPRLRATGRFRVEKIDGRWWLVDPEGNLFWSHGVNCVGASNSTPISDRERYFRDLPGPDSPLARFYGTGRFAPHGYYRDHLPYRTFDFAAANLFRKYGEGWKEASAEAAHRRLRSWGMNTIANWSDPEVFRMRRTPYVATIDFSSKEIEGSQGYWRKFPDVFDGSFRDSLRRRLEGEKNASAGDSWCIGFFVHNELSWGDEASLAAAALASPPGQPAKRAFAADLEAKYGTIGKLNAAWGSGHASWAALLECREPPDRKRAGEDLEAFYSKTAETYFKTIREELAAAAPGLLYLGCRFAWVNDRAARAAAKFCDVISYNRYETSVEDLRLPAGLDVPLIIGEFHFGALDRGMFHPGLVPAANQEERAARYRGYVEGALRNPYLVGTHWFQYQDQATTGRGDGENYQIGLVDLCDRPYPETIRACREVGYHLYEIRLGSRKSPPSPR